MGDLSYRVRGAYFESCNCEAICPCRTIAGVPGGRSSHGECYSVLSWQIEEGLLAALSELYLGGLGGPYVSKLPWIRKARHLIGVRPSRIEIEGTTVRIGDAVSVRATRPVETELPVACIVPGYDRAGRELYADELRVDDEPFAWRLEGNCAYVSDFDYTSG